VVQGLFGAVMLPQGLGIIKQVFPPKEIAAAFGMFGPIMGMSSVGGPVLAGWARRRRLLRCRLAHDLPDQPAAGAAGGGRRAEVHPARSPRRRRARHGSTFPACCSPRSGRCC
jgi:hypothetical protein